MVAVVPLSGLIGPVGALRRGLTLANLSKPIERAFRLRNVSAVALAINSPGGSAVQAQLIHRHIRSLAEERRVPVFAFAEDVAASGGYWLAAAADELFANENSIVGSIGVIYASFGFAPLLDRLGIERRLYTAGPRKSLLDPFRPEDPDEVARLKALQHDIHESFKTLVRVRRAGKLRAPEDVLFSGEFWTGRRALELGLVDGIGDLATVMRERYGKDVRLRVVRGERDILRTWFRLGPRRLGWSTDSPARDAWAAELLAAVEERLLWHRYGL
ncbi:MAG: S49 family peptidase [Alphaproteobacteria bacterium]